MQKTFNIKPYLVEQIEDRWYVGIPPDDYIWDKLSRWCDEVLGIEDVDWGVESDDFYSLHSSGMLFWFTNQEDMKLFQMRCW